MDMTLIFVLIFMLTKQVCGKNKPNVVKEIRNTLALEILESTLKSRKNTIVAILPLQFSLCKLASVATGKARQELLKALGFSNDAMVEKFYAQFKEMMRLPLQSDLTYVNKIYLDYNKNINMKFAENSTSLYGVHVDKVSYSLPRSAANFINRGIATVTYRRVENVLNSSDINNLTSLLLITAGHFKPSWEERFDSDLTSVRPFQFLNNTRINIPMMSRLGEYQFYDARDFRVVTVRLGSWGCSITFVQPDFVSIDKVFDKLITFPGTMKSIREQMGWKHLKLVLPRMKIKSQIDLEFFLQKIGIKQIFDSQSTDLNAILKTGVNTSNITVSKVRQKLFLEVDEFGLSRVNRELTAQKVGVPPNTLEIAFDRPFYFTVNLELSQTDSYELFNGIFCGPE